MSMIQKTPEYNFNKKQVKAMLNYIWGFMLLIGIIYGALTGNIASVGNGIIDSAREAVSLCITMLGVVSLWTGIMEIAKDSGLIDSLTKRIVPLIRGLFPDIPIGHRAWEYISLNIIANILGLGWAATPAGLKAMEELRNVQGRNTVSASNAMCTFLVLNISSLQLIPVNIIAYRSQYGSVSPASIVAPAIIATMVSTLVAVIYCMIMNKNADIDYK